MVATTPTSSAPPARGRAGRGRARRGRRRSPAGASRGGAPRRRATPARPWWPECLLDRERLLRVPGGRSSSVRSTPARRPASGSSSSIGASEPSATTRAGVQQRAVRRTRRRRGSAQKRSARSRSDVACDELHRRGDAERREARHVLGRDALRVLDPLAQAERAPVVARRLERVERLAVGEVADRVHGEREARLRGAARIMLGELARGS